MARVKLTNVKKIYDKNVVAVHDFNLDIADKEFVVFVGPSGCGKSTKHLFDPRDFLCVQARNGGNFRVGHGL